MFCSLGRLPFHLVPLLQGSVMALTAQFCYCQHIMWNHLLAHFKFFYYIHWTLHRKPSVHRSCLKEEWSGRGEDSECAHGIQDLHGGSPLGLLGAAYSLLVCHSSLDPCGICWVIRVCAQPLLSSLGQSKRLFFFWHPLRVFRSEQEALI